MTLQRQLVFWLLILAFVAFVLWLLADVLLPFVLGLALAYLLNPLADRIERVGAPRWAAALVIVGMIVLLIVLTLLIVLPIVAKQTAALIEDVPGYVRRLQDVLSDPSRPLLKSLIGDRLSGADKSVGNIASQAGGYAATVFGAVWSGGRALFSAFSLLVVAPVVTFYLLADWPRMVGTVDRFLPREHYATLRDLIRQMNEAIAGFVRGQTLLCVFLGLFYAVALTVVGLKFGLIIGLVTGVLSFIPYVGSLTGLLLALGAAFAQFWPDWIWIAVVLGIFLVGQFIEGNVLGPKLVGESVGLHPLWLMLALFAFGYLFGFVGLLLAVPLAAVAGVLVRFALRQYLASPLYTGEPR